MNDRRVHGRLDGGPEIVRYDRAGKWYLEWPTNGAREQVAFKTAVSYGRSAMFGAGEVELGLPGGTRWDRAVCDG